MIYEHITNMRKLYQDLQKTSGYKDNFSCAGAYALMEYLDDLSEDIGENIEYDPIGFCCEYSEYADINDFNENYYGNDASSYITLETLKERTNVIVFDNSIIIRDF